MTTNMQAVSAESQRRRIPSDVLMLFEEITNAELASLAVDDRLTVGVAVIDGRKEPRSLRAFAGWELEYREAFGIEVYYDEKADVIKRRRTR